MEDIWQVLKENPKLGESIEGGKGFEHKSSRDKSLQNGVILESAIPASRLVPGFVAWKPDQLTHELPTPMWLNLHPNVIRRIGHGSQVGVAQIIMNHSPVSREAWRLKALVDLAGHPVKGLYLVWRPKPNGMTTKILWALLNSPIANAFVYCRSSKRHVMGRDVREMPAPQRGQTSFDQLDAAVEAYFKAVKGTKALAKRLKRPNTISADQLSLALPGEQSDSPTPEEELKYLHWRIDAEVFRLYDLPAAMERRILDLFTGVQRRGVPFTQSEYFPKGFTHLDRLSDLLAITADWTHSNRRRCHLIRKDVKSHLNEKEKAELQHLESLADTRIALMDLQHPTGPDEITLTVERLKREGKWQE
jgi:hypothetical protein